MKKASNNYNNLINLLSENRLCAYKQCKDDDYSVLLERYLHNIKISQAFYPLLSILEIALRNKIHYAIEEEIKPNWLFEEIEQADILKEKEHKILTDAKNKLIRSGAKVTKGHLIAELSFGFWVHLCTKGYKIKLWHTKNFFKSVFKNYPNFSEFNKLAKIYPILKQALATRNRIFHHEIITNNPDIENIYFDLKTLLSYIDKDAVLYLEKVCDFKEVIKQKP